MYLPQPILPQLAQAFSAPLSTSSLLVALTILGLGLASPLLGLLADRFGVKSLFLLTSGLLVICLTASSLAPSLELLLGLRFIQGLLLPGIMVLALTYAATTLTASDFQKVSSRYVALTVIGGLVGRILAAILTDLWNWRLAFGCAALLQLYLTVVAWHLPATSETQPRSFRNVLLGMKRHLYNPDIIGSILIGFCLFFAFQAVFTYMPIKLSSEPFFFGASLTSLLYLSFVFGVLGALSTPYFLRLYSNRRALILGFALLIIGNMMSLSLELWLLGLGLCILCFANWWVQSLAIAYIATSAHHDRASANALYLLFYYLGGSLGAFLPSLLYSHYGYTSAIVMGISSLLLGLFSTLFFTKGNDKGK